MKMSHAYFIFLIFGLAHAFAPQDSMSCKTSADCFPEENGVFACKDNLCALAPGRCFHEEDCPKGHYCELKHCKRECDSDKDCDHLMSFGSCMIPKCLYPQNPDEPVGCQLILKEDAECDETHFYGHDCADPFSCENCKCVLLDPENHEYSFLGIVKAVGDSWIDYLEFRDIGRISRIRVKKLTGGKEMEIQIDNDQNTTCIKEWKHGDALQMIIGPYYRMVSLLLDDILKYDCQLLHRKSGQRIRGYLVQYDDESKK